jgi:hypothetical protein
MAKKGQASSLVRGNHERSNGLTSVVRYHSAKCSVRSLLAISSSNTMLLQDSTAQLATPITQPSEKVALMMTPLLTLGMQATECRERGQLFLNNISKLLLKTAVRR